jgi:hypothetical protein
MTKRYKIECEGGGVWIVYRVRCWGLLDEFIGVETSEEAAIKRAEIAAQYPKYVEV